MVDPVPVLPQLRAEYTLSFESLTATFDYSSNGLWIVSTIEKIPQVEILAAMKGEEEIWETTITVNPRMTGVLNVEAWEFMDQLRNENQMEYVEDSKSKPRETTRKKIAASLPFGRYELAEPNGFTGGILVLWNSTHVDFQSISVDLHATHGIVQRENENWSDLENIAVNMNLPWVAIGDFNDVTSQSEKLGGRAIKGKRVDRYLACMNNCGLHDIGFVGNRFTWTNKCKKKPIFQRLDRAWDLGLFVGLRLGISSSLCLFSGKLLRSASISISGARVAGESEVREEKQCEDRPKCKHLQDLEEDLTNQLQSLYQQEESYWKMRARSNWLTDGDRNTKFFQTSVLIRRKRNKISNLFSEVGEPIREDLIQSHIVSYFKNLFSSEMNGNDQNTNLEYESVICIAHPPTLAKVHSALFSIGPLKAPGVDGFHALFFQNHRGTMWPDILSFVSECFESKSFPVSINDTSICLIPKTDNPESIKQYRPISLCNTSYKIVSKLIVHRLRPLLNSIISPNQNSFLSEKAYDRIEWSFIRFCLHRHGFDRNSTDLIMSCVTSTTSKIRINGALSDSFHASRGLRKGDPISPYLFIICMEYLSTLINNAHTQGEWNPFMLKRGGTPISHLMFADDLLLFGEANANTLQGMCSTLDIFWDCSGHKPNHSKSKLYFSKNTHQDDRSLFTSHLKVNESPDLGIYLGFPLTDRRPSTSQMSHIAKKIRGKLASWKAKCLSKAGRLTLIKSTLSTIANYSMQALALPGKTVDEIDKICSNFLWDSTTDKKRTHLVAWDRVCAPVSQGSLNVRKTSILNLLALVKLCWRLNNVNNLAACNTPNFRDVGKGWENFASLTEWCTGNGENILLWEDNWTGKGPLRTIIHRALNANEERLKWIQAIPIVPDCSDIPVCTMGKGKYFDSKATYDFLWNKTFKHLENPKEWNTIWGAICHPKQKVFLWLMLWNRLPCASHLFRRMIIRNSNCMFCQTTHEDLDHLFIACPKARQFWDETGLVNHVLTTNHSYFQDWIVYNLKRTDLDDIVSTSWPTLFINSLWSIWLRRNLWVFKKESKPIAGVWKRNQMLTKEMLNSRQNTTTSPSSKPLDLVTSCYYVQVDASFCQNSLSVGYAAICRL
ncbi:uncharacterized protein [Spinacia oleracea]|uniref:Reverse transcriptase domain-containing protein n=1 Tax=Spinacia oleracea TaxID=3562 RepID=A0ABM3RJP8_SPIOL|nr:uncharacterized protein LOC130470195 [Spinacia oleracea]